MSVLELICESIEKTAIPCVICDGGWRTVRGNSAFAERCGCEPDDLLGIIPSDFVASFGAAPAEIERIKSRLKEGTPFDFAFTFGSKHDPEEKYPVGAFVIPLVDGEISAPYYVGVFREVESIDAPFLKNATAEYKEAISDVLAIVQAG